MEVNLADLSPSVFGQLSDVLSETHTNADGESLPLWTRVLEPTPGAPFHLSVDELNRISRQKQPAEALLRLWGNRGQTVLSLLVRLQTASRQYGAICDLPQLVLKRKFYPVKWAKNADPIVTVQQRDARLDVEVRALGFPMPTFQWLLNGQPIAGATTSRLSLPSCSCLLTSSYSCRVRNEISDGAPWSAHYKMAGKVHQSEIVSNVVQFESSQIPTQKAPGCEKCAAAGAARVAELMEAFGEDEDESGSGRNSNQLDPRRSNGGNIPRPLDTATIAAEPLVAADKVALIISNCTYRELPPLSTPHCDAETLATQLQTLRFKTVTLADLTLDEMRHILKHYRKLLGDGVYAVLYFAGHGFEVNGQVFLLPVDAAEDEHDPEKCISIDWLMSVYSHCEPALNLVLLDVCRKFIPYEKVNDFVEYQRKHDLRRPVACNLVFGFATAGGVGAYEVRGEPHSVFMKHLERHVARKMPVVDMLVRVLRDVDVDGRVRGVQVPELRSTLTRARSLYDPLCYAGHTISFDQHTAHWQAMHELPVPVRVVFADHRLAVTIWFNFCGHFSNKVYVFASVEDAIADHDTDDLQLEAPKQSAHSRAHRAQLIFTPELELTSERVIEDEDEGVSMCWLLSGLQRAPGELDSRVELVECADPQHVVATQSAKLGHVLLTRLCAAP